MNSKDTPIVVTGGSGLLGCHLLAELADRGYNKITVPVRSVDSAERILSFLKDSCGNHEFGLRFPVIPQFTAKDLRTVFSGARVIFHCAAAVSLGQDASLAQVNHRLTAEVLEGAVSSGVREFIHVSSIATLSRNAEGVPVDQSMRAPLEREKSPYAAGKILAEREVEKAASAGLGTATVLPSVILGVGPGRSAGNDIAAMLSNNSLFYTEGITGFVDVKDVARAMVEIWRSGHLQGQRYLLSGANLSYRELVRLANKHKNKGAPRVRLGRRTLSAAATVAGWIGKISGTRLPFDRNMARLLTEITYYNGSDIQKSINFEYSDPDKTIGRIISEHQKKTGKI